MNYFLQKTYADSEDARLKAIDQAQLKAYYRYKKNSEAKNNNNSNATGGSKDSMADKPKATVD